MGRHVHVAMPELLYLPSICQYLIPWARIGEPREDERNPETAEKLYKWLEEQVSGIIGNPETPTPSS